jgi:hypothetical protein
LAYFDDEAVAFGTPYYDLLVLVLFEHAVEEGENGQRCRLSLSVKKRWAIADRLTCRAS